MCILTHTEIKTTCASYETFDDHHKQNAICNRSILPRPVSVRAWNHWGICHGLGVLCCWAHGGTNFQLWRSNVTSGSQTHHALWQMNIHVGTWVHQNRASPFASDFCRRRGYRREFRSESHFYPFYSQKKSRFASDFLRRGNRAPWGLKKSRDFLGSGKNRSRSRRESRDFGALTSGLPRQCHKRAMLNNNASNQTNSAFMCSKFTSSLLTFSSLI